MSDLSLFQLSMPVDVRYADIDALQHVNNVRFFTYMESARVHYFEQVLGWSGEWRELGIILARATCDYRLPLRWGDQVRVYVRVSRLGTKSFEFAYAITRENDPATPEVAAEAATVQVAYDYERNISIPIPDAWRTRITAFEPGLSLPEHPGG